MGVRPDCCANIQQIECHANQIEFENQRQDREIEELQRRLKRMVQCLERLVVGT